MRAPALPPRSVTASSAVCAGHAKRGEALRPCSLCTGLTSVQRRCNAHNPAQPCRYGMSSVLQLPARQQPSPGCQVQHTDCLPANLVADLRLQHLSCRCRPGTAVALLQHATFFPHPQQQQASLVQQPTCSFGRSAAPGAAWECAPAWPDDPAPAALPEPVPLERVAGGCWCSIVAPDCRQTSQYSQVW